MDLCEIYWNISNRIPFKNNTSIWWFISISRFVYKYWVSHANGISILIIHHDSKGKLENEMKWTIRVSSRMRSDCMQHIKTFTLLQWFTLNHFHRQLQINKRREIEEKNKQTELKIPCVQTNFNQIYEWRLNNWKCIALYLLEL